MDRLNAAIADKVLEISNADNNEVRVKLQKINRFKDFIYACQSLIKKYPEIETELLQMVHDNDFDARIASVRVDTIIRLSDNQSIKNTKNDVEEDIHKLEDIIENLPVQGKHSESSSVSQNPINGNENNQEQSIINRDRDTVAFSSGDKNLNLENKEPISLPEAEVVDEEKESQYIDFEEVTNVDLSDIDNVVNYSKENPTISINDKKTKKEGATSITRKILWVVALLASIVILYVVVTFVIDHWTTILWILGIFAIITLLFWYLLKRKKQ